MVTQVYSLMQHIKKSAMVQAIDYNLHYHLVVIKLNHHLIYVLLVTVIVGMASDILRKI